MHKMDGDAIELTDSDIATTPAGEYPLRFQHVFVLVSSYDIIVANSAILRAAGARYSGVLMVS